jgi:hypothetical protein
MLFVLQDQNQVPNGKQAVDEFFRTLGFVNVNGSDQGNYLSESKKIRILLRVGYARVDVRDA